MRMRRSYKKQIEVIMESFNFKRVLEHMSATNWKWVDKAPSIQDLRVEAIRLMKDVTKHTHARACSSGGFEARKIDKELFLTFKVAATHGMHDLYY